MGKILYPANERGFADHGWLQAKHSFSFADYYDPNKIHFGQLRVLNDDIVAPGMGFAQHPHENMEIITLILKGALEHKDSMGHVSVIKQGEVQIMSAGKGITHSEYNHSKTEPVNLLQIWVFPKIKNIEPRYDQKIFSINDRINKFQTIISPEKEDNKMWINQDAYFSLCHLKAGETIQYNLKNIKNAVYLFVMEGKAEVAKETLNNRDAIGVTGAETTTIKSHVDTDFLIIELPIN
ncbi:MAG: pirin family protein [Bacteroidota bacterium]|nr:pirin family protein [Bacteroidota bacterium]